MLTINEKEQQKFEKNVKQAEETEEAQWAK